MNITQKSIPTTNERTIISENKYFLRPDENPFNASVSQNSWASAYVFKSELKLWTIFCFLGHLGGGKIFEKFARETNLKKKRSVNLLLTKIDIKLVYLDRAIKSLFYLKQVPFTLRYEGLSSGQIISSGNS